ncbi:MAG TPA: MFS transporter [Candidatus Limnocylindrales bacterium]|nr:MFS transporter [Candidatus Limnocylindrales bacterium]
MTASSPSGPRASQPRAPRLLSAALLGAAGGAILVPLNSTMLAVALPGVQGDFGLGPNQVSSLVTLYLGAVAVALPVGGSIGDRYGHRPTFLAGVLLFAAASLVAAIATTFELLELSRVGQAASGALISTSSAALVRETAPSERQGEAFGLFDLLVSTSAAVGPFVGGVVVGWLGWRSMFFLAIPIAVIAAAFVGLRVRRELPAHLAASRRDAAPIDWPGLALLAVTISAFVLALRTDSGAAGTVAAVATLPLAAVFVAVELRRDRPAVDPRLFVNRPFAAALAGVFGSTVILHGSFILVPQAVEELLHETATTSGIALLGIAGVAAVVAPFGGRLSDRRGRRLLVVTGAAISAAGLTALAIPGMTGSVAAIALLLGVVGFGNGLTSPRQAAAFESVDRARIGMAAGTYYTGRYLGGVVGASLAGAMLGAQATATGVSNGFTVLALVGIGVAVVSLGLRGRTEPALLPFR